MRTAFLCLSVLRVASGPRVKMASCKSALNPPVVYFTDHSMAMVPVLFLLFVALWFILRGDVFYVLPCVILFLCFLFMGWLWQNIGHKSGNNHIVGTDKAMLSLVLTPV